jgi:predicted nucleic acid-binding protein
MAAQADLIICSDMDLLVLQRFNGISMLSLAQAAA